MSFQQFGRLLFLIGLALLFIYLPYFVGQLPLNIIPWEPETPVWIKGFEYLCILFVICWGLYGCFLFIKNGGDKNV
jgi:hypothetical protein